MRVPINQEFFCDGSSYLLTSSSLGGSDLTAEEVSETLFEGNQEERLELFKKGVCFPIVFEGDCALDRNSLFVLGDLSEEEEKNWIGRLAWKLNIPCGKLILCCGWCDEDLERAVALETPDEHYVIHQIIDVPPDEYLVEIFAYFSSMTVQVSLDSYDEKGHLVENKELAEFYKENYFDIEGIDYIIRLKPFENESELSKVEEGWFEEFEFRTK